MLSRHGIPALWWVYGQSCRWVDYLARWIDVVDPEWTGQERP
jgi:hypothetical protein